MKKYYEFDRDDLNIMKQADPLIEKLLSAKPIDPSSILFFKDIGFDEIKECRWEMGGLFSYDIKKQPDDGLFIRMIFTYDEFYEKYKYYIDVFCVINGEHINEYNTESCDTVDSATSCIIKKLDELLDNVDVKNNMTCEAKINEIKSILA